mgnify:FL=1
MSEVSWLSSLAERWGEGWKAQEAVRRWPEIIGARLGKLARARYVENGVLHIAVASPVVANELRFWSKEILARLTALAPASRVRELCFELVPQPHTSQAPRVEVTPSERNEAEDLVPVALPLALREKLVQLLATTLAQERGILAQGGRRCRRCGVAFLGEGESCPLCQHLP